MVPHLAVAKSVLQVSTHFFIKNVVEVLPEVADPISLIGAEHFLSSCILYPKQFMKLHGSPSFLPETRHSLL
jgi:hypothetical protein